MGSIAKHRDCVKQKVFVRVSSANITEWRVRPSCARMSNPLTVSARLSPGTQRFDCTPEA